MRNLVPILLVALAFGAMTCQPTKEKEKEKEKEKKTKDEKPGSRVSPVGNRYVVFFKESFILPIVRTHLSELDADAIAKTRNDKIQTIQNFCDFTSLIPSKFMLMWR